MPMRLRYFHLGLAPRAALQTGFEDGRIAIVITTDDAGHGLVDGNDRNGTVVAEVGELDGLEAHGISLSTAGRRKHFD